MPAPCTRHGLSVSVYQHPDCGGLAHGETSHSDARSGRIKRVLFAVVLGAVALSAEEDLTPPIARA